MRSIRIGGMPDKVRVRVHFSEKEKLRRAAIREGVSLSEFVRQSALRAAGGIA